MERGGGGHPVHDVVFVAPFVALSTVVLYDGCDVSPIVIVVLETATYVLSWVLFPLATTLAIGISVAALDLLLGLSLVLTTADLV